MAWQEHEKQNGAFEFTCKFEVPGNREKAAVRWHSSGPEARSCTFRFFGRLAGRILVHLRFWSSSLASEAKFCLFCKLDDCTEQVSELLSIMPVLWQDPSSVVMGFRV